MKVNLLLDYPVGVRLGYLNIDPFVEIETENIKRGDITNLDKYLDDGEVEEIVAHEILDYFGYPIVDSILQNWLKKLKIGGTLTFSVIDFEIVARDFTLGTLDIDKVNSLLHGPQKKNWDMKKSTMLLGQLVSVLETKGMKILKKRNENYLAVISVQRTQ